MAKHRRFEIFHTDAFDWLSRREGNSIHAVVTDPPYGIVEFSSDQLHKQRNGNGGIWRLPQRYDGHERSPKPRFTVLRSGDRKIIREFHSRLAPLLLKVLVPGGHVILSSHSLLSFLVIDAFSEAGFEVRGQIARVVRTLRGGDRPKKAHERYPDVTVIPRSCWEPWLIFRRPCEGRVKDNLEKWGTGGLRRPATNVPFSDLIHSSPARGVERRISNHPSLKPQAFMRQIVWAALPLGTGIILDPFMGSASTIAAAEHLGLRSIGLEVDEEYFLLANSAIPLLTELDAKPLNGSKLPCNS